VSARDEIAGAIVTAFVNAGEVVHIGTARTAADAILGAGFTKANP